MDVFLCLSFFVSTLFFSCAGSQPAGTRPLSLAALARASWVLHPPPGGEVRGRDFFVVARSLESLEAASAVGGVPSFVEGELVGGGGGVGFRYGRYAICDGGEEVGDADVIFGGGFEKEGALLRRVGRGDFRVDLPSKVALVAGDGEDDVLRPRLAQLRRPVLHLLKTRQRRHVVDQNCRGRTPVVHPRQGMVLLLARRVPEVHLHRHAVHHHHLAQERRPDRRLALLEVIRHEPLRQARLTHARVAQQHHLDLRRRRRHRPPIGHLDCRRR
mmetsp:Transcript_4996/g.16378  ORF Transcript_4996/g.16378 Transcript_4996/m.16378 type:complete len:272 (-) Transcript_4996:73-888(-)